MLDAKVLLQHYQNVFFFLRTSPWEGLNFSGKVLPYKQLAQNKNSPKNKKNKKTQLSLHCEVKL